MSDLIHRLLRDQRGATAIEYGIMLSLIAMMLVSVTTLFGQKIGGTFNTLTNTLK